MGTKSEKPYFMQFYDFRKPRRGSERDVQRLKQIMTELGFLVKVYDDLTMRETVIKLKRYGEVASFFKMLVQFYFG